MDTGDWRRVKRNESRSPDHRPWWAIYSDDQLLRAERRLAKAWRTRCPLQPDGSRAVNADYFASNRVQSRRQRQAALRRWRAQEGRERTP
jgi:hypothetical protein